jgi:hypothetical protein
VKRLLGKTADGHETVVKSLLYSVVRLSRQRAVNDSTLPDSYRTNRITLPYSEKQRFP